MKNPTLTLLEEPHTMSALKAVYFLVTILLAQLSRDRLMSKLEGIGRAHTFVKPKSHLKFAVIYLQRHS